MLVNVQPEQESSPETLCSLRFAKQVSQCTTGGKAKRSVKTLTTATKMAVNDSKPKLASQPTAVVVAVEPRREKERSVTPRGRVMVLFQLGTSLDSLALCCGWLVPGCVGVLSFLGHSSHHDLLGSRFCVCLCLCLCKLVTHRRALWTTHATS